MFLLIWRGGPVSRVAVLSTVLITTAVTSYVASGKYGWEVNALAAKPHRGATADAPRRLAAAVPADYLRYDVDGHSLYAPSPWMRHGQPEADLVLSLLDPEGGVLLVGHDPAHDGRTLKQAMDDQPSHVAPLMSNFAITDAEIVQLNGERAGLLEYSGSSEHARNARIVQFVRVHDGREYTMTFMALAEHYGTVRPVAEEVAASWRLPGEAQDAAVAP